jgi:phage tail-like protein
MVDPSPSYNFTVEIDGIEAGSFSEASGLDVEIEVIEYRNGSDQSHVRKLPGLTKFSNITLKRGFTGSTELWDWMKAGTDGQIERKDGAIVLRSESGTPVARWIFRRGWPCKWHGPGLQAGESAVAIETLEIAHEGLELETA